MLADLSISAADQILANYIISIKFAESLSKKYPCCPPTDSVVNTSYFFRNIKHSSRRGLQISHFCGCWNNVYQSLYLLVHFAY